MKILVTGVAGFIGSHVARLLAQRGDSIIGIDNINDYYDVKLKLARLHELLGVEINGIVPFYKEYKSFLFPNFLFYRISIDDKSSLEKIFSNQCFDVVVNLAAQAGVRYSITHPYTYIQNNIVGFFNVLEACRNFNVPKLVYASSSSVYGMNDKVPYNENDKVDSPVSLYAASKKSNELMAHCYSKLFDIQTIGLRYFTVYGPWGRPDMSPMLFADAMYEDKPIHIFNNGNMIRDFTYINDIVEGTICAVEYMIEKGKCDHGVPYKIYNIGCGHPVMLMDFISEMENAFGKKFKKVFLPMQNGDVYQTNADCSCLQCDIGYRPSVTLHEGLNSFVDWYKRYRMLNRHNP